MMLLLLLLLLLLLQVYLPEMQSALEDISTGRKGCTARSITAIALVVAS
jgi:hypothetical protein